VSALESIRQPGSDRSRPEAESLRRDHNVAFTEILGSEYNEQRWRPRPGQPSYLPLADLRLGLGRFASGEKWKILDYGCGGSPYRGLFPNSEYRRADALDADDLDYRIGEDQLIAERPGYFDLVLSTQVLEHVSQPERYLAECHRLLRPGGRLILSTHGMFEEHGIPYDFHRWTAGGLKTEVMRAGFDVPESYRLTTDSRAAAFLFEQYGPQLVVSRRRPWGLALWYLVRVMGRRRAWFHEWCDSTFAASRVVDAAEPGHGLTIGLLLLCVKR
jgi:SAM-dependent methyltransferase